MNKLLTLIIALFLISNVEASWLVNKHSSSTEVKSDIKVYFSPHGGCTDAIVDELNKAKQNVKIQAYGFSSPRIARAILNAKNRGLDIGIILDKSNEKIRYSGAKFLDNYGILVLIDHEPRIAHSKIMILDESVIITGSFNFTKSAEENNTENLLIIRNHPEVVKQYLDNFEKRKLLSKFYDAKSAK